MIESPWLDDLVCRTRQKDILRILAHRFGVVPPEMAAGLRNVESEESLDALVDWAMTCPDLEAFRGRLAL